jgi:hypothetical protein
VFDDFVCILELLVEDCELSPGVADGIQKFLEVMRATTFPLG